MIAFRYRPLTELGQLQGWFALAGYFDGEFLHLQEAAFPVDSIVQTELVEKILIFEATHESGTHNGILLITSGNEHELKQAIDRGRSAAIVARAREAWKADGNHLPFRQAICPCCSASLDLTRFETTPQIYCSYCETLSTVPKQPETPKNEHEYRVCESCGMFARPRRFTEFYVYILVFHNGFWSQPSYRCPACMRSVAWKMVLFNAPFVVGLLPALGQLARAYLSDQIAGPFSGLHRANLNATRKRYREAIATYRAILDQVPFAAGIHYNLGLALFRNQEWARAKQAFQLALEDCSNYPYAASGLMDCLTQLGDVAEFARIHSQWPDLPVRQHKLHERIP